MSRLGRHLGPTDIEPSCGVLDVLNGSDVERRIVVDCGSGAERSGGVELFRGPDLSIFDDGRPIDAVLVTHAHHDHTGCLPALVPFLAKDAGFIMTRPTAMALAHSFRMELNQPARAVSARPYGRDDVLEMLRNVIEITRPGEQELLPGMTFWVHPAGHISGACSFTALVDGRRVHYAGDRCDHDQPGILGAEALPDAWRPDIIAGSDCTYGHDTAHVGDWRSEMDRAAETCRRALEQGRRVMFYAFALHRAGVLAHELQRLGLADAYPVWLDGSAGQLATMFSGRRHIWCGRDSAFDIGKVGVIADRSERQRLLRSRGGHVLISPPGMGGPGGIGSWWRKDFLPDPDAIVAFTGYVAADADGAVVLKADAEHRRTGRPQQLNFRETDRQGRPQSVSIMLRSQVEHFRLGGHNDRSKTIDWFRQTRPEIAVLSHGSPQSLEDVEAALAGSVPRLVRADKESVVEIDL